MADNRRDEITSDQVTDLLQQLLLRHYPNPDRVGCRGSAELRKMAERRLPHEDPFWNDHVSHCSPCYREFLDFRNAFLNRQARRQMVSRVALAAAVALVLAASLYFALRKPIEQTQPRIANEAAPPPSVTTPLPGPPRPNPPETAPPRAAAPQQPVQPPILSAVLNLESESATRNLPESTPKGSSDLQRLPRGRLALVIYLPLGSEAGDYDIRLLKNESDANPLATFSGTADVENGLTALRVSPDLRKFEAGPYVLGIRHGNESWRYYRFALA